MIARGSFGNPWIFGEARALLDGRQFPERPDPETRLQVALRHARLQIEIQGDSRRTAVEFRKHLGWYVKGMPGAAALRDRLHHVESMSEVDRIFGEYLEGRTAGVG
jgi:tRNA-dihydrouridine synthase